MNALFYIIIIGLWLTIAIFDYCEFCYIWQLKEYRLDRFRDFISTRQGKNFIKSYLISGRTLFFGLVVFVWFLKIEVVNFLFFALVIIEALRLTHKFFKQQIKYPKITTKSTAIVGVALLFEIFILVFYANTVGVLLIFALRFFVLTAMVFIMFLPTKIIKSLFVLLATKKMKKFPALKIIGITGSYGKTTVKNFLNQILCEKFKVIATPKNINTEIGVAKFILKNDFNGKEIFIVEMGAYNIGEIKMICDMVKPEIGILTAINEQHLSLFGSIKNIQETKYELLLSLPQDGLAVTNADNKYCMEFLVEIKSWISTFGCEKKNEPNYLLKNVIETENAGIIFSFEDSDANYKMTSPVIGKHNALNICACIPVARWLGMNISEISKQVEKLKLPEGTLQIKKYGPSVIIDDSYNSNPQGFRSALETLKSYPDDFKKIVITRGMIELGEKSAELHVEIGKKISEAADELVIIANNNENDLKGGAKESKIKIFVMYNANDLLEYVKKFKEIKCVILLENRLPAVVHNELTKSL
jgi:UDP-N-acetylmuramoyl-tripeptide--D-alanyl-D-alanine ligase